MRPTKLGALIGGLALALVPVVSATPVQAADTPSTTWIVTLREGAADPGRLAADQARRHGGEVRHVYRHALSGFAVSLPERAADALRRDPRVVSVQRDQVVTITAQDTPTGIRRIFADDNANLKLNGTADYEADVDIAIIDTGVDADHPDLNVVERTDCLNKTTCTDGAGDDGNGHGSHVAGTAAAVDNGIGVVGVAPGARIWSVRVLDNSGSGQLSGVTAGVDWVAAHADEIEVANMSLGCDGCTDNALSTALTNAVDKGVVFTVAAGNNDKDAKTFFPANHPDVITVSALADFNGEPGGGAASTCRTDTDDTLADFSNFGSTVEIAAPGACIYSTYKDGGYSTLSGTSMAAPHVAGAAALLATGDNDPTDRGEVEDIREKLLETANTTWTDESGDGVREPLLDVGDENSYPAPPRDPGRPTAGFTATCSNDNTTCSFDAGTSTDSDGTVTGYTWDFGDGTTGTGKTVSHTYAKAGYYSVKLTVTDNQGKTDSVRRQVKAGDVPPTAAFGGFCQMQTCTFNGGDSTDPEGDIAGYRWNFGDGTTGSGENVRHTYTSNTFRQYTVTLTVSDSRNQTHSVSRQVTCYPHISTPLCYGPF
ncbi:S8 family serine peptidase [Micromonospora sp. BQ11]|uniref:S8 family serine peptidase n=1 Tax=Micromonospora sp. BQ11 TaxID=3452212 RepID=UPI003F8C555F